ncbi:hypothetical protein DUNSADRAFT_9394 [Dunaliella salina]|uniref:Uncharacterized protein n=1 Tax=Dunaliella salina TaxID=3046 RepID=A0ABQ7GHJ1_DUNSA|nr:hypothetical protein DUNSADRAFT_9394 [Dunaliella salina]|eukprot:KAF5834080.1 hypothetical protein DUNSADRAFT_9394 [Dunaliella salina]
MESSKKISQPATQFLDLEDNVLGILYGMLQDSASKKALRHSCGALYRSPAVNAQLDKIVLRVSKAPDDTDEDKLMDYLQAFPVNATLRELTVVNAGDWTADIFERALFAKADGVRERLRSVHRLSLLDCNLETGSNAAYWSLLFSKFGKLQGGGELDVHDGIVHTSFLSVLSTVASLRRLTVDGCCLDKRAECLSCFNRFTTLTNFEFDLEYNAEYAATVHALDLAELRQLESLRLGNMTLDSFDKLLRGLPCLQKLGLSNVYLPSDVRLASSTLKELRLSDVGPDFPVLEKDDFPALQTVLLLHLHLGNRLAEEQSEHAKVMQVFHMASWLSKHPVKAFSTPTGTRMVLNGSPELSAGLNELMLLALSPLKPCFMSCQALGVMGFSITTRALVLALCNLASNVQFLDLRDSVYSGEVLKCGLLAAVEAMPHLQKVSVQLNSVPRDVLAALTAAQQAGRQLNLDFSWSHSSCQARLQEMREEWSVLKLRLPGPLTADLSLPGDFGV